MNTIFKEVPMGREFLIKDCGDTDYTPCVKCWCMEEESYMFSMKENTSYRFCLPDTEVIL